MLGGPAFAERPDQIENSCALAPCLPHLNHWAASSCHCLPLPLASGWTELLWGLQFVLSSSVIPKELEPVSSASIRPRNTPFSCSPPLSEDWDTGRTERAHGQTLESVAQSIRPDLWWDASHPFQSLSLRQCGARSCHASLAEPVAQFST